ncbi:MAG: TMEM43 family protein [Synergistaceae bacterium]|nr:TMEM43 family protein [Synergistaceae bacterium]
MAYTVTESKSWFKRISESVAGITIGFILIAAGTWLLWWNEERTFKTAGAIAEAELVTQNVEDVSRIDPALEGKLIHASARAETDETVTDSLFGIKINAINLRRNAEYYQWQEHSHSETRKKLGGGEETVTTYTYSREWVSSPIDSNKFEDPSYRGRNKILADIKDETFWAGKVSFGAYRLPDFLKHSIGGEVPMTLQSADTKQLERIINVPSGRRAGDMISIQGSTVYIGQNPGNPSIGDVRVTFTQTPAAEVSLIAKVIRDTFEPFRASNGYDFSRLSMGTLSTERMFEGARSDNSIMAWILRAVGVVCVIIGLRMIFAPLSVIADVIPILGTIVGAGAGIVAMLLGMAWSMCVVAVAWVRFRPLIAGGLIAGALLLVCVLYRKGKNAE